MASKIKVDQIQTADGTGTIALQNQLSGMTTTSLPAGAILQTVESSTTTTTSTTTTSTWIDTASSATITPASTSSKILVFVNAPIYMNNTAADGGYNLRMSRAISGGSTSYPDSLSGGSNGHNDISFMYQYGGTGTSYIHEWNSREIITGLDSPSTTSAVTYKLQIRGYSLQSVRNNTYGHTQITLIEMK